MSALIKQGAADVTRALPLAKEADEAPVQQRRAEDPRDVELTRLGAEIEWLRKALAEAELAQDRARELGHEAGLAEAERDEGARLAALQDALADAGAAFETQLQALEGLAPRLARAALEKLCVPQENWAALIEAIIARQLGTVRRSAVVALRVSARDFDEAGAAGLAPEGTRIDLDPKLESGAARIELKLGQIDLDVREQWAALAALLDEMAGEAA